MCDACAVQVSGEEAALRYGQEEADMSLENLHMDMGTAQAGGR